MHIEPATTDDVRDLAVLLVDAVDGGACVGFRCGLTVEAAASFWTQALAGSQTWVARADAGESAVGVVQLHPSALPNGAHRAGVAKLLVHRSVRGRGVARALMDRLERSASAQGRWLLQLDTETGSVAETLYRQQGWQVLGVLDRHAVRPGGELSSTTFMFKEL